MSVLVIILKRYSAHHPYWNESLLNYHDSQSVSDASKFYNDKVGYVKKNLGTLEKTITDKQSTLRGKISMGTVAIHS